MQVPRRVVRFNNAINNPIQSQYAWLLPPWAIVAHRGRRSGRLYRTPVIAFRRGSSLAIGVLYGDGSDWVQNVLAGGGSGVLVRGGRTYELVNPRLADVDRAPELSAPARAYGRISGRVLLAELGARRPGFGRGPLPARS